MSKDKILQNHHSLMLTFWISLQEEDIDFSKLYCSLTSQESVQAEVYCGFC